MKISQYGPLLIRLALGSCFILHGSQKVFGMFGGPGLHRFSGWLSRAGVPIILGYAAAGLEFIGGCMIFFGIATEVGALMCAFVMLGAIVVVHTPDKGYFAKGERIVLLHTGGMQGVGGMVERGLLDSKHWPMPKKVT